MAQGAEPAVPELVRALVAAGVAIHAVMPARQTLEERFMSLLGAGNPNGRGGEASGGPAERTG